MLKARVIQVIEVVLDGRGPHARIFDFDGMLLGERGGSRPSFRECAECAAKPGSPTLCEWCLAARAWADS